MEKRWIVLGEDGRHVSLSRVGPPENHEVAEVEKSLRSCGLAGWLVELKGDFWAANAAPSLVALQPLASPASRFEDAALKFERIRQRQCKSH